MKTWWMKHLLASATLGFTLLCTAGSAAAQFQQSDEIQPQQRHPARTHRGGQRPHKRANAGKRGGRPQGNYQNRKRPSRHAPRPVIQKPTVIPGREPYDPSIHVAR